MWKQNKNPFSKHNNDMEVDVPLSEIKSVDISTRAMTSFIWQSS